MQTPVRWLEAVHAIIHPMLLAVVLTPAVPAVASGIVSGTPPRAAASAARTDSPAGKPPIDPATTGTDAERALARMLPPRSDSPRDWQAPLEPLHACGEPRLLPDCVPPPPCHPTAPPAPFDLVGARGVPTCGPIYRGPCAPRSATRHEGPWRWLRTFHDRLFDAFYTPR